MKQGYTHISVILDRSGSMEAIRDDTIGGFNAFLARQKAEPGTATLTLVQFDSQDPYEAIHRFQPIREVPLLTPDTYVPRGGTPLLDAFGRGINDIEKSIADLKEEDRPEKVLFAVVTDGHENASCEFRKDQIEKMVKEKTDKAGWQFVFLSADMAAIHDAQSVGIPDQSTLFFLRTGQGTRDAWAHLSSRTEIYRSGRKEKIGFGKEDNPNHPEGPPERKRKKKRCS